MFNDIVGWIQPRLLSLVTVYILVETGMMIWRGRR